MNRSETLREYFRRARHDPAARAKLMENARYARACFGWFTLVFGILALGQTGYNLWRGNPWMSGASVMCTFGFAANWLIYDKFGDRIDAYASMGDEPSPPGNPKADPGS